MSELAIFTLFYLIFTFCVIYPPVEFVSAGLTIPIIFARVLGSEDENFIVYHIRRTLVTILVYSVLPLVYILIILSSEYVQDVDYLLSGDGSFFWKCFFTTSIVLPLLALYQVRTWTLAEYENHPIAKNLSKFCNNNTDWKRVASDINTEFRRIDKISIRTNPLVKVIATENWILKVTPLTVLVAHQSDTSLLVNKADTHNISYQNSTSTQYLNIEVKSARQHVETFTIRINAADFKDLEDRIARDITISPNVKFHKSIVEQFIDVFKEQVENNPPYVTNEAMDMCIGCMQARPNVKLQKLCQDPDCNNCYCKPMWCVECVARWFVSRQESEQQTTWLTSKCTCPMCRQKFCILDVCLLPIQTDANEE